ncbi:aldo/keto reductase [Candidatus Roizmanbacteria bacterium]|nr:aldo/keto reductase [Candidatus Roizmanbacteria bacterium]
MNYRKFGRMNWKVSEVGYGMWGMGGQWGGTDDTGAMSALHKAVDLGVNFFDTAWVYGNGHSEQLLGKLIKDYKDKKLYITSKIPPKNFKWPMEPQYRLEDTFPTEHMLEYTKKSLANLDLQSLDLILLHGWDDAWANDKRWQESVKELKKQGQIKAFGVSIDRWEPENAIQVIKTGMIDAVEVIYNIFDQAPEDKLFSVCREFDVAVIARVPFDEGTLTGTLTLDSKWQKGDWRNKYFSPEVLKASVEHAKTLEKDVPKHMTMSEMAIRFILSNPDVSTTIPGMRRVENVKANIASSEKGKLDPLLIKKLRSHRWDRKPSPNAG